MFEKEFNYRIFDKNFNNYDTESSQQYVKRKISIL